jgi:hypothetical protein
MSLGDIAAKPGAWFHRAFILRLLTLIHTASGRALRNRMDMEWKTRALADFSDWLDGLDQAPPEFLPEDPADQPETDSRSAPQDTGSPDGPDLYTLLSEFVSLKKQIQVQTREQSRNLRGLKDFNTFAGEGRQLLDELARQVSRMGALEDKLREETTADILQAFLDIRDSLAREKLPLALKRSQEAESLCRYAGLLSGRRRKIRPAPAGSSGQQRKQDNRDESIWYMRYSFMIFITLSSKQERRKVFIGC